MNNLNAFVTTWLLDANDVNFDNTYDNPSDNFIDYLDFATLNSGWTYTPAKPEKRWYYMKDALGSTMGLVGSHPNASSEFHLYDVYGKPNTTSAIGNPFMYAGKRIDLYGNNQSRGYFENRNLNFYTGRWMTPDPLGVNPNGGIGNSTFKPIIQTTDGMNLYEYVQSNPVMNVDFYGLFGSICGSQKSKIPASWIPDDTTFLSGADFGNACQWHDDCYGCQLKGSRGSTRSFIGKTKADCDKGFLDRMKLKCDIAYGTSGFWGLPDGESLGKCYALAEIYYGAVKKYGEAPFREARKNTCCTKALK